MTFVTTLRLLVIFCMSPCDSISSSGSVIGNRALCTGCFSVAGQHCCSSMGLCADYVVKFASPSCVRFISFGFLLATTCVWVWMVCSLHSVTTGSRDRANVSLIIIGGESQLVMIYLHMMSPSGIKFRQGPVLLTELNTIDCSTVLYLKRTLCVLIPREVPNIPQEVDPPPTSPPPPPRETPSWSSSPSWSHAERFHAEIKKYLVLVRVLRYISRRKLRIIGSIRPFYRMVKHIARVWINREWLPILLVVS